jgi:predicted ATP-grasp superfamily ATP-dependent carboligase
VETDWLGIWNADFVQTADGWYLLEINPRWSAGMELIDRGWQHSIAWHHAHAVGAIKSSYSWAEQKRLIEEYRKQVAAPIRKEILYLKRPWRCTEQAIVSMWGRRWGSASPIPSPWYFGDIPQVKTELGEGYPLCSLFTEVGNDDPGDTKWIAAKAWLQREYQIPIA